MATKFVQNENCESPNFQKENLVHFALWFKMCTKFALQYLNVRHENKTPIPLVLLLQDTISCYRGGVDEESIYDYHYLCD